ncbi:putative lumazine-binding protein [Arcticibacter tournemirensis]|uniref:nuclear transport factor 2 family protein n=1 Tax=Arcticibacter tournemirensis TaxID=699437 RepID=UPI0011695983|nr:nuclear transport factor 2 family protein [Arcticibacter tournemirensis]TQM52667.1 putative lumazine-binding protein [Arcticibacter tournemirensis]
MKTLKNIAAALLFVLSVSAFAAEQTQSNKSQIDAAVTTYIDALNYGKIKGLSAVLDQDLKFTVSQGQTILNYNKTQMIESLKAQENIVQNCKTDYTMIESNPGQAIAKVTMKYDGFSKVNFVTLSNTSKGWKITNISSSYN